MPYDARRGGHAPGHLRDALAEWIEEGQDGTGVVVLDDEPRPLGWLLGQLWNCTDTLPRGACAELGLPAGSTYAQAARRLRPM